MPHKRLIYKALYIVYADWTGLEPATSAVTGRHSNQLNYQSFSLCISTRFVKNPVLFFGMVKICFSIS